MTTERAGKEVDVEVGVLVDVGVDVLDGVNVGVHFNVAVGVSVVVPVEVGVEVSVAVGVGVGGWQPVKVTSSIRKVPELPPALIPLIRNFALTLPFKAIIVEKSMIGFVPPMY